MARGEVDLVEQVLRRSRVEAVGGDESAVETTGHAPQGSSSLAMAAPMIGASAATRSAMAEKAAMPEGWSTSMHLTAV